MKVIKKLRNRFLIMNMVILTLVMLLVFISIFVSSWHNNNTEFDRVNNQFREATFFLSNLNTSFVAASESNQSEQVDEETEVVFPSGLRFDFELNGVRYYSYLPYFDTSPRGFTIFGAVLDSENNVTDLIYTQDLTYKNQIELIDIALDNSFTTNGISPLYHNERNWHVWRFHPDTNVVITDTQFIIIEEKQSDSFNLIVITDMTPMNNAKVNLTRTLGITGLIMLVVLALISLLIANLSIKPVQAAWDKQQRFIADASHELKTPITNLNANLDAVQSNAEDSVSSQQKWLDNMRSELARMSKLASGLLYLARTEGNQSQPQVFDLSDMVSEMSLSWEAALYERDINYSEDIAESVMVQADPEQLRQALNILMENAQLYTEPNGWIKVTLSTSAGHALLSYQNSGPGIASEDIPKIFDRFFRPDPSRSAESGGFGLGLSIAKATIEQASGRIKARSSEGVTEFSVSLRLAKSS